MEKPPSSVALVKSHPDLTIVDSRGVHRGFGLTTKSESRRKPDLICCQGMFFGLSMQRIYDSALNYFVMLLDSAIFCNFDQSNEAIPYLKMVVCHHKW